MPHIYCGTHNESYLGTFHDCHIVSVILFKPIHGLDHAEDHVLALSKKKNKTGSEEKKKKKGKNTVQCRRVLTRVQRAWDDAMGPHAPVLIS